MEQLNLFKEFSVLHEKFYKEFESWFSEVSKQTNLINGVYTLYVKESICRVLATDTNGTLYIGKGIIVNYAKPRIGTLVNSLNNTAIYHEAGERYNKLLYKAKFPLDKLILKVELFEDAGSIEALKLDEYLRTFGELPPLNRIN